MQQKVSLASIFRFLCLILTLLLLSYCTWRYIQDGSTSLIDVRTYHTTKKDIYPSLSLCFYGNEIYDRNKLNQTYGIKTPKDYMAFLEGQTWEDKMTKIEYDDVTMDLSNYVQSIDIAVNDLYSNPVYNWHSKHGKAMETNQNSTISKSKEQFPFVVSFRQASFKCFSLDLSTELMPETKDQIIRIIEVTFRNLSSLNVHMSYYMHYPNQLIRTLPFDVEHPGYPGLVSGTLKEKNFRIQNVEVIRRRNTFKKPCNEEWRKDDHLLKLEILQTTKCKPPNWVEFDYQICTDKNLMVKTNIREGDFGNPQFLKSVVRPCDELLHLSFNFVGVPRGLNESLEAPSKLNVVFKTAKYKEILHIRAFNIESLLGNMGGYVGLFLGFSIWQIPEAVKFLLEATKR